MKKAKARCEQIFDEDVAKLDYPVRAMVLHANCPEEGQNGWTSCRLITPTFALN